MITFGKPIVDTFEIEKVKEVLESGIYVHGSKTQEFEGSFSKKFGYPHALSVANCTAGLHLAHFTLTKSMQPDFKNQYEVLCPAMTHVATAHAIELAGLKPKFIDCNPDDGNMDVDLMEAHITDKTVGVAAMHFNGIPCDIKKIVSLAEANNLYVVEDCAISLGAKVDGQPVGTFGQVGAFSFHPVKQMTTGEGGMVVMNDALIRDQLALEKAFGVDRAFNDRKIAGLYDVTTLGFNYRMAEIPAAMGIEQLKKFSGFHDQRKQNYLKLLLDLEKIDGVTVKGKEISEDRSYYCLIARLDNYTTEDRDKLSDNLKSSGVQTSIYYPHPVPRLKYYADKYGYEPALYPNAIDFSDHCLAFPIAPHLTEKDMNRISQLIQDLIK